MMIRVAIAHSAPSDISITNGEGKFYVNGRAYRGELVTYKEAGNKLLLVNILPLEEYLTGLLGDEMPLDWPLEALKAQAVVARSYALFMKRSRGAGNYSYDLESTVMDQVYEGADDASKARLAVEGTAGEVLMDRGELVKTFYHSTCGGRTESALNVWGEKNSFRPVKDSYCSRSPKTSWQYSIANGELASRLTTANFPADTIRSIQLEKKIGNPRAATIIVKTGSNTLFIQGNDFRKAIGFDNLKSTWFDVRRDGDKFIFSGRGYGHGVGMCQWGAKGMAEAGEKYKEILRHYYPGTRLGSL